LRSEVKSHKDLTVWQKAVELVSDIYTESSSWPKEEIYGLISQIRRAAVSVPSNIAEGAARGSNKDFIRFLNISLGSLAEVDTQIEIAKRLKFLENTDRIDARITEIRRMLIGLKKSLGRQ